MVSGGTIRWAVALGASAAAVLLTGLGCSSDDPTPTACPPREATFRVEITADDGDLPEDTSIAVRYQGSEEERFDLPSPANRNVDVCCRPAEAPLSAMPAVECSGSSGPPDAGRVRALYCELWTNGLAEVTVTGGDYPEVIQTLQAVEREDECGLELTPVRIVLAHPDGG